MTLTDQLTIILPSPRPTHPARNLLLFAFRQMGANGIEDACAAHAYMSAFGRGFRRPLLLTRSLMLEMAAAAQRPIHIAPSCCGRMTASEAAMLAVAARAVSNPVAAGLLLADMLAVRDAGGPLATVAALADAFADLGQPLDA